MTLRSSARSPRSSAAVQIGVDALVRAFVTAVGVIVWRWFEPLTVRAAETLRDFSKATSNFIYTEPTTTIGMRKIWFWLVMPYACVTLFIHAVRNLANSITVLQETA